MFTRSAFKNYRLGKWIPSFPLFRSLANKAVQTAPQSQTDEDLLTLLSVSHTLGITSGCGLSRAPFHGCEYLILSYAWGNAKTCDHGNRDTG